MKKLLSFYVSLLIFSSVSAQSCLTSSIVADNKKAIITTTSDYFSSLNNLLDSEDDYDTKAYIISGMNQYFNTEYVVIENDNERINIDKMKMKEYAQKLAALYSRQESATISYDVISVSEIHQDEESGEYIILVKVNRKLTVMKDEKDEKGKSTDKPLWIFYRMKSPKSGFKISSIQLAKKIKDEKIWENRPTVAPCSNEQAEQQIEKGKPYIEFDIEPANAAVKIDEEDYSPIKGQKYEMQPGSKKVIIYSHGFVPETLSVTIPDTGVIKIRKRLSLKMGTVSILPSDQKYVGAKAMLKIKGIGNDKPIGTIGSISNYQLPYGIYKIKVTQFCRIEKTYKIVLTDENPKATINVALEPIKKATKPFIDIFGNVTGIQIPDPCANVD